MLLLECPTWTPRSPGVVQDRGCSGVSAVVCREQDGVTPQTPTQGQKWTSGIKETGRLYPPRLQDSLGGGTGY